jgi:RNA polymerase sigma-54 factor
LGEGLMKLDFGLQMQQEQKLIMTQELQLAVKILQLTSYELCEYIDEQLMENPLLEAEYKEALEYDRLNKIVKYLDDDNDYYANYIDQDEEASPLNFVAKEISLWEYLKEQLSLIPISKKFREIGEYIIDNIDENGYLTVDVDDICYKCKANEEDVKEVINIVQGFEPSGICARNISECLILQLKHREINDEVLENIINNMLEDVGKGKISKIAKENGISIEKAEQYVSLIKTLDPKPGIRYFSDTVKYIIPDVIVEKIDGRYVVTVNDDYIPHLKINSLYKKILNNKNSTEYKYVKEKLQSAMWIIKSIDQRMNTIKKVVEAIIKYQISFFDEDGDLKPLTLKQIANETELHESTISRAIKGKYVQTPKGLFEIKNFFIRGIQNKTGEEVGTLKIKNRIREIIEGENKAKPYSDQQIADIINKEGISVSRRTIAKYREEMNIPSSSARKSF